MSNYTEDKEKYVQMNTSGSFQYSLNKEGLLTQISPTPAASLPLSSSAILTYHKHKNVRENLH